MLNLAYYGLIAAGFYTIYVAPDVRTMVIGATLVVLCGIRLGKDA